MSDLERFVRDYLDLKDEIEECEEKQDVLRDQIRELVPPYAVEGEIKTRTPAGDVTWVKGRISEKVDHKVLKQRLVLAGVPLSTLEEAWAAASTVSEGQPTLRITPRK